MKKPLFISGITVLMCILSLPASNLGQKSSVLFPVLNEPFTLTQVVKADFSCAAWRNKGLNMELPTGRAEYSAPASHKKRTGRAILESLSVLAVITTHYWIRYTSFIEDWQFGLNWPDQKKRFFTLQANRFDSNAFTVNSVTHALQGAVFYNFTRTNNLNIFESLLTSTAASLFWEYITEWREVISINDNIFSSSGGLVTGEPLFQLSRYLFNRPGKLNRIFAIISNPVFALNRLFDRKKKEISALYESPADHSFRFAIGMQNGKASEKNSSYLRSQIGLETHLDNIPPYAGGNEESNLKNTVASDLALKLSISSAGIEETNFSTRVTLFGKLRRSPNNSLFLGFGSAFDYSKQRSVVPYDSASSAISDPRRIPQIPTEFTDKFAIVEFFGPLIDWERSAGVLHFYFSAGAYPGYAHINAYAFNTYTTGHDILGAKTSLLSWGYYYAWGYSLQSRLGFSFHNLSLQGWLKYHRYGSIEGRDRFQDQVYDDFHVNDSRLLYGLQLSFRLADYPLALQFSWEGLRRYGRIKDFAQRQHENRLCCQLAYLF